jgi:hypothetical protein
LVKNPDYTQKQTALVMDRGEPVAVAAVRHHKTHFEPITQWLTPGLIFPVKPGYLPRVLDFLGVDLWVGWWRLGAAPTGMKKLRSSAQTNTYRFDLSQDVEAYWRKTGHFKSVRLYRNRCKGYDLGINLPGAREWTIRNWAAKWHHTSESPMIGLNDRLLVSEYLENAGRYFTFTLSDNDEFIAGATISIHKDDMVAGVNFRNLDYDKHGVGNFIIEHTFLWGADAGYKIFDLGGGHAYKAHWAPEEGQHWLINVSPNYVYHLKQLVHRLKNGRAHAAQSHGGQDQLP